MPANDKHALLRRRFGSSTGGSSDASFTDAPDHYIHGVHITKHDGKWYVKADHGSGAGSSRSFDTHAEARAFARDLASRDERTKVEDHTS